MSKRNSNIIKILVLVLIVSIIAACYKCGIFKNCDAASIKIALLIALFVFSYVMKKKISFKNLQENAIKE